MASLAPVLALTPLTASHSLAGADVIKVERPLTGDDTRAWNPPSAPLLEKTPSHPEWASLPPESAYYLGVNRNKRSITLDLKKGRAVIHELVRQADVLVENYVPGKLAEMGLGYEDCRGINPALVYCSITGECLVLASARRHIPCGCDGLAEVLPRQPGFDTNGSQARTWFHGC